MEQIRKPFQGVGNIIRFNWHFYLFSSAFLLLILLLDSYLSETYRLYATILLYLIFGSILISLFVSFYVYDLSELYKMTWLSELRNETKSKIVNINAGFDETSTLLKGKSKDSELIVFDFYDPLRHTEVSIKRARKAYPPHPDTQQVNTSCLPLPANYADKIFVILAAHEIRNSNERIAFFKELNRIVKPTGQIMIIEHLRNVPNFVAYNIGFFHFHSKSSWHKTFQGARLNISKELKITPFITTFILEKNGASS